MRRVEVILAAAMAIPLAGCVVGAKNTVAQAAPPAPLPVAKPAPAPPPAPLSMPQTQVTLPPPQPVTQEAIAAARAPEQPVEPPPAPKPPPRRPPAGTATPLPRTDAPLVVAPAPSQDPTDRPPLQEMLPEDEKKQLQQKAADTRRQVRLTLQQVKAHHLTKPQNNVLKMVESFVTQSDGAEKAGDMRLADALAERALVLARELQNGK